MTLVDLPLRNVASSADGLPPLPSLPCCPLCSTTVEGTFPDPLPYELHHLQDLGSPGRGEEISSLHPKVLVCIWFLCRGFFVIIFLSELFVLMPLFLL